MLTSTTAWKSTPLPVVAMVTNTCPINWKQQYTTECLKNEYYKSLDLLLFLFSGFVFLSVDEKGKLCLGKFWPQVVSKKTCCRAPLNDPGHWNQIYLYMTDTSKLSCSIQCSFISDDLFVSFLSWTILPQEYLPQKRKESWAPTFSASGEVSQ